MSEMEFLEYEEADKFKKQKWKQLWRTPCMLLLQGWVWKIVQISTKINTCIDSRLSFDLFVSPSLTQPQQELQHKHN